MSAEIMSVMKPCITPAAVFADRSSFRMTSRARRGVDLLSRDGVGPGSRRAASGLLCAVTC